MTRRLNVAAYAHNVTVLGPGRRLALWVQGCHFDCPACIAPSWQPFTAAHLLDIDAVLAWMLAQEADGVTFSGGEPLLQAAALCELWSRVQMQRPAWTLILFTGFTEREIQREHHADRLALWNAADAVIDGRYVEARNDGVGLRGSANQTLHFPPNSRFTDAERDELRHGARRFEMRPTTDVPLFIGIPPKSALAH